MTPFLDGEWSEWSKLSTCAGCDADGNDGLQYHTRTCTEPSPKYNGSACTLSTTGDDITGPDGIQTESVEVSCNCPVGKSAFFASTPIFLNNFIVS